MAGGIDQIQAVGLAVLGLVTEAHRPRLDRNPPLLLQLHGIQKLGRLFAFAD